MKFRFLSRMPYTAIYLAISLVIYLATYDAHFEFLGLHLSSQHFAKLKKETLAMTDGSPTKPNASTNAATKGDKSPSGKGTKRKANVEQSNGNAKKVKKGTKAVAAAETTDNADTIEEGDEAIKVEEGEEIKLEVEDGNVEVENGEQHGEAV